MTDQGPQHTARGSLELVPATLLGVGLSLVFSILLNYLLLFSETVTLFDRSLITAIALPIVIGGPLSFVIAYQMREVRRCRREFTRSASYDRATQFFNGNVFPSVMDRRIAAKSNDDPQQGAFLIVNADNLRSINMRYGLDWGEEALRLIASTIRCSVRSEDVVGRLGDSEFGIFLPGATEENAREVGKRIKAEIADVYFAPTLAGREMLGISVAGVTFEGELTFDGAYRAAERQLDEVGESGGLQIAHLTTEPAATAAAQSAH